MLPLLLLVVDQTTVATATAVVRRSVFNVDHIYKIPEFVAPNYLGRSLRVSLLLQNQARRGVTTFSRLIHDSAAKVVSPRVDNRPTKRSKGPTMTSTLICKSTLSLSCSRLRSCLVFVFRLRGSDAETGAHKRQRRTPLLGSAKERPIEPEWGGNGLDETLFSTTQDWAGFQ